MSDDAFRYQIEEIMLVPSKGGVFEVTVDDKVIFSKKELSRHAEPGEIVAKIRGLKNI